MLKAAQAYFQTQVVTTSQGDLLLMLYDGAIKFIRQAQDKIKEKDYAAKGILISRAIDVISELDSSLNQNKGGDLAKNLHELYFFCNTSLFKANLKMDVQLLEDVIKILSGLRAAFAQITNISDEEIQKQAAAMEQNAPAPKPAAPSEPVQEPAGEAGSIQTTAYSAGNAVKKPGPAPAPQDPAQRVKQLHPAPNAGRMAAGSNIYKKMASQS